MITINRRRNYFLSEDLKLRIDSTKNDQKKEEENPRQSQKSNTPKPMPKPYIYMCPTLYQETKEEIETLITSILRLNRYRLDNLNKKTNETPFDFQVDIFFDNCFVDKKYKIPEECYEVVSQNAGLVKDPMVTEILPVLKESLCSS